MRHPPPAARIVAFELAVALGGALFYLIAQRPILRQLLALALGDATHAEQLLVPWTACAQTIVLLMPVLVLSALLVLFGRERLARHAFALGALLVLSYTSLDLAIYLAFGRHLGEVLKFLFVPGAANGAGSTAVWLFAVARTLLFTGVVVYPLTWGLELAAGRLLRGSSAPFAWVLAGAGALALLGFAAVPHFTAPFYRHLPLRASLDRASLWGSSGLGGAAERFDEPGWTELARGLRESYAREFPRLYSAHAWSASRAEGERRPSVLVIVVESWRADSLTAERMPRAAAWAARGLVARRHYAGSDYSEAGMFSIFYGRSPLLYHATLDAHEPPVLCGLAHALGYVCGYYSGQPTTWMRAEEFINPRQIDRFVHDDSGSWNDWDRRALASAVSALKAPGSPPQIAVVYLMSTHFEYRYPPEFELHQPVAHEAHWLTTDPAALGAADVEPLHNRYLNALAFTDRIVSDAIAELDPQNTIVVLTGDHGEAFGEASHFSHGYGFGEAVSRVPFALVGPGVPASTYLEPSTHADLLPTLAHALGVHARFPREARDLLAGPMPRPALLLAHCSFNRDTADALLVTSEARLRLDLGLRHAEIALKGLEDPEGRPLGRTPLTAPQVASLMAAFDTTLNDLWRD